MPQARSAQATVHFVDNYCEAYQDLFVEVRSFEAFCALHVGFLSELPRKTIPAISKAVGWSNPQGLHHFISDSPWSAQSSLKK